MEEISESNGVLYLASRKRHDEIDAKNFRNKKNQKSKYEPKHRSLHEQNFQLAKIIGG